MITMKLISNLSLADLTAGSAHVGRLTRHVSIADEFVRAEQRAGTTLDRAEQRLPTSISGAGHVDPLWWAGLETDGRAVETPRTPFRRDHRDLTVRGRRARAPRV